MSFQQCPLCLADKTHHYYKAQPPQSNDPEPDKAVREFQQCPECDLIFVPSDQFLSKTEEKSHYDYHQNNPDDIGYRRFLSKLYEPMIKLLDVSAIGLDYGSGPGPTLSVMLEERGHSMSIYDYMYATDESVLNKSYDFITCTETIEHFRDPRKNIIRLWTILNPGGYLGIMTKLVDDQVMFANWHYKNDPTHICFYSMQTIHWLATFWKANIVHQGKDVIIFQKPEDSTVE